MVLAGMLKESVMRKAREEGRREAREEGRREAREEWRRRWDEACAKFGVEVNGVLMLPWTPEVRRFLDGEDDATGR